MKEKGEYHNYFSSVAPRCIAPEKIINIYINEA